MAVLTKHILGTPSGTVGDSVCFTTWKGKACVRSLASSVNDPNTVKQQAVRAKFSLLGETLVPLAQVINAGWKAFEKSGKKACTALNAYMKYHLKDVEESELFNGDYPDFTSLNADKLLVARGSLTGPQNGQYSGGRVTFTFSEDYDKDNIVYAVLYNPTFKDAVYTSAVTDATTVTVTIEGKEDWSGDTYLYYFVTDAAGNKASNSTVTLAAM